jgi:hypothetical protein
MLVVRPGRRVARRSGEAIDGMGDVSSFFRSVGSQIATTAKQAASGAVQGAGQSIGSKLRSLVSPGGAKGGGAAPATSYLPWVLGAAAVVGVGYLATRRR